MRIFKTLDGLCGEMLNLELGQNFFDGDKPRGVAIKGYPSIKVDGVDYYIKAADGHIYYTRTANMAHIIAWIEKKLIEMEEQYINGTPNEGHLNSYHAVDMSVFTTVKAKPKMKHPIELPCTSPRPARRRLINITSANQLDPDSKNAHSDELDAHIERFRWLLIPIDMFDMEISDSQRDIAITRHMCSIMLDIDDITKFSHGDITYHFGHFHARSWDQMLKEKVSLCNYSNVAAFELNAAWKDSRNLYVRDITGPFQEVDLSKMDLKNGNNCAKCNAVLYDRNYILVGSLVSQDATQKKAAKSSKKQFICEAGSNMAVCPLCVHFNGADLTRQFRNVYVARWEKTVFDVIAKSKFSKTKADILTTAITEGIKEQTQVEGSKTFTYYEIGNKYLAFSEPEDFLYSKFFATTDKKICIVNTASYARADESVRRY